VFVNSPKRVFFMEPAHPSSADSPDHPGEFIRREWQ